MKRLYKLEAVILAAIFILTGCGAKLNSKSLPNNATHSINKKKITFATNRGDKLNELSMLAQEFMSNNPGTEIEIEAPQQNFDRIYKARLAVNELPDITATPEVPTNVNDYFIPLDDLGFPHESFLIPPILSNGKIYGIPIGVGYDGIIYSKAAFKNAGITKVPRTLNELYDACQKLKTSGITPFALNAKDKWPATWYTRRYPKVKLDNPAYETDLLNKDLLSPDSPVVNILNTLKDMNQKGYLEPDITATDWDQMKKGMANGKVGMTFLGTWLISQLIDNGEKPEDIGMFPFPETKVIYLDNDFLYSINKNSKHIDVAQEFMKFAWKDSRISNILGLASPFKISNNNMESVKELLSFNIPAKCMTIDDSKYISMLNASGIDINSLCIEYLLSNNPESIIKDYNERWNMGKEKMSTSNTN